MNDKRRDEIRRVADYVAGRAVDESQLVELGFASLLVAAYPDWQTMPREQIHQLRAAFFAGAQHLWASLMGILDPGSEPTERDLRRMDLIHYELDAFIEEYKQRHGITDADVGPPSRTRQ